MPPNPLQPEAEAENYSDPADWVSQYGDTLLRFALGRVANRDLAEDLVQETLLAAFRHRAQFKGKSSFGTWLVTILKRKIVDDHRRRGRSPDLDAEPLLAADNPFTRKGRWSSALKHWRVSPTDLAENAEFWTIFQGCLTGLPTHLAQAFQLRELKMVTVEEASHMIGITPRNLAVRLHRARLLLRQCLEKKWFQDSRGGTS